MNHSSVRGRRPIKHLCAGGSVTEETAAATPGRRWRGGRFRARRRRDGSGGRQRLDTDPVIYRLVISLSEKRLVAREACLSSWKENGEFPTLALHTRDLPASLARVSHRARAWLLLLLKSTVRPALGSARPVPSPRRSGLTRWNSLLPPVSRLGTRARTTQSTRDRLAVRLAVRLGGRL